MTGPLAGGRDGGSDDALIRAVYNEHGQAVLAYATKLTGDRAAVDDVLQEAMVRAWRHSEVLVNGKGSVRGWLLTVAGRIVVDRARANLCPAECRWPLRRLGAWCTRMRGGYPRRWQCLLLQGDGHYVAWDTELMGHGFTYGDSWAYLVVAHEWGHAIQAQLAPELQSAGHELQADCLAGAALYGSARDGNLQLESGDEREIANGLTFSADDIPWTRSDDHGDALERIQWFAEGRSGSVSSCLPTS